MKTILISLLVLVSITAHNQKKISGEYSAMLPHTGASTTLKFKDPGFTYIEDNGMTQVVGAGKFIVKNDSLFLNYQQSEATDSSVYSIDFSKGTYSATTATIMVNVFEDSAKEPFKHAYVTVRDKSGNPVLSMIADAEGKTNAIMYPNQQINTIDIGAIGYYSAVIPVSKLYGRAATINVYLKPATKVHVPAKTESYKILSLNNKRLILQQGDDKITFVKQ